VIGLAHAHEKMYMVIVSEKKLAIKFKKLNYQEASCSIKNCNLEI